MGTNDIDRSWESRVLCSDESCIGVIGRDGRCKECGLPFEGELPANFNQDGSGDAKDESNIASPSEPQPSVESEPNETLESEQLLTDDEWSKRTLCSDESCIGVIGPDGRCKECGKR
jgi:hypothetical protein